MKEDKYVNTSMRMTKETFSRLKEKSKKYGYKIFFIVEKGTIKYLDELDKVDEKKED